MTVNLADYEHVTGPVIASAIEVHKATGAGVTYMRLANCPVGLIINFNVPRLVDGLRRKVNPRATAVTADKNAGGAPGT